MNIIPSSISIYSRKSHTCRDHWPSGLCSYRERGRDVDRSKETKNTVSILKDGVKRIYDALSRKLWSIQRFIRAYTERYTIYVLECEDGKYYVGSTTHRKQRLRQHLTKRGGSSWTRQHKPIRVVKEYKRIPELYYLGLEAKVTAECMQEYGINNVRGAMFSLTRDYTVADLDALTGFLGHHNNLNYREVSMYLNRTLPRAEICGGGPTRSPSSKKKRKVQKARRSDRCHNCGERGHWAANCTNQRSLRIDDICYNCGKCGHWASECPNLEDGRVQESSEQHQPLSTLFPSSNEYTLFPSSNGTLE
jgi:hypothetical protein